MQASNDTTALFVKAFGEYNTARLKYESMPKPKVVDGQPWDYVQAKAVEIARVEMDIALSKVVSLRQAKVPFLQVKINGCTTCMIYNPFGNYLDELTTMEYEIVPVLGDNKPKDYTTAANDTIKWYIKKMSGDINDLYTFKFADWISGKKYNSKMSAFAKSIAIVIRYYPHKLLNHYDEYMASFFRWFMDFETDSVTIGELIDEVLKALEDCVFKETREKLRQEGTLVEKIEGTSTEMKIKDCSIKCNNAFVKLRLGSESDQDLLASLKKNAQDTRNALDAKLGKKLTLPNGSKEKDSKPVNVKKPMSEALKKALDNKRTREEMEENEDGLDDEHPKKKIKLDQEKSSDHENDNCT